MRKKLIHFIHIVILLSIVLDICEGYTEYIYVYITIAQFFVQNAFMLIV